MVAHFFLDERMSASLYEITSDAAGSKGYGALSKTHWFYGSWPESWQSLNITALELFPLRRNCVTYMGGSIGG